MPQPDTLRTPAEVLAEPSEQLAFLAIIITLGVFLAAARVFLVERWTQVKEGCQGGEQAPKQAALRLQILLLLPADLLVYTSGLALVYQTFLRTHPPETLLVLPVVMALVAGCSLLVTRWRKGTSLASLPPKALLLCISLALCASAAVYVIFSPESDVGPAELAVLFFVLLVWYLLGLLLTVYWRVFMDERA